MGGAAVLFAIMTAAAIWQTEKRPYLTVGWFWFVIVMAPTVGLAWSADRFMYLALVGLAIAVVWSVAGIVDQYRFMRPAAVAGTFFILLFFTLASRQQNHFWKNDRVLFERALALNRYNYVAHNNLGNVFVKEGRYAEAVDHFVEALNLKPDYADAYNNRGLAAADQGSMEEALWYLREGLKKRPGYARAHYNLANLLVRNNMKQEAVEQYEEALRIDPNYENAKKALAEARSK